MNPENWKVDSTVLVVHNSSRLVSSRLVSIQDVSRDCRETEQEDRHVPPVPVISRIFRISTLSRDLSAELSFGKRSVLVAKYCSGVPCLSVHRDRLRLNRVRTRLTRSRASGRLQFPHTQPTSHVVCQGISL